MEATLLEERLFCPMLEHQCLLLVEQDNFRQNVSCIFCHGNGGQFGTPPQKGFHCAPK